MILEIIVYAIIGVFIGISQAAGIGGGPILNICLMIGLGKEAKDSMSITYIFLMGGAFASMFTNAKIKNPKTGGPIMDYSLIMITLPMAACGSIFGTLLNHFISELVITILFTILLGYLFYNSYQKYKATTQVKQDNGIKQNLIQMNDLGKQFVKTPTQINPRLQQILEQEKVVYPKDKLKVVAQIFIYTILTLLLKGGGNYNSILGFESCGFFSYLIIAINFGLSILYSKSLAQQQFQRDSQKQKLGFKFENASDKMSEFKMRTSMMFGFLAGLLGGALGLGGAIILVPVWLNSGIDKQIATSSSGPLIFFSALVAYILGVLSSAYDSFTIQIFYFVLAFAGAYLVKAFVNYLTEKYNLKAMIFILLMITMGTSLVALLPYQLSKLIDDGESFLKFGVFC